jgi:anaerobic magnesium-protoporphyrin IX monomethyl ester cyclase
MLDKIPQEVDQTTALHQAILSTIVYRDLFDYPVTLPEIHRYLHGECRDVEEIQAVLQDDKKFAKSVCSDGEYYALANREHLFSLRRARRESSGKFWSLATRYTSWLASLPFVEAVAVTGSLAVDNAGEDADVDIMLITEPGRMWTVRAMAKLVQLADRRLFDNQLCANYLVSTAGLELSEPGLYIAQELAQSVPTYGHSVYDQFRASNPWTAEFLPNAEGAPRGDIACEPKWPWLRRVGEFVFRTPFGRLFEGWERDRKMRKYNETAFWLGVSTPYGPDATGHRRTARRVVENAFSDRLRELGQPNRPLRVLFGQAYHLYRDPKLFRELQPFPPLGCLYAASIARTLGCDVRVHDSMLSLSVRHWAPSVQLYNPDVVVLFEDNFNYLTKMCLLTMRDAALEMLRVAKSRGAIAVVCSSDAADESEIYLDAGADYILIGEGEETLAELLPILSGESSTPPEHIQGLAFRNVSGEIVNTPPRPVMRKLDSLPLPAWDLIELDRYEEVWTRSHGKLELNLVTTRGCPYHCNWCAKPIWGQRYNARSPTNVVAEIDALRSQIGVEYFWFMDDIFGLKPGWVRQFSDQLDESGTTIRFKCLSRPDILMRNGEVEALASAGADIVWMGAESGSQKILDAMEKGTTVEMIHSASTKLRKHGIRVGLFIQFGYPGESWHCIRQTIAMLRQIMPDELGISVTYPLPGTRLHERVKEQLCDTKNWKDSDDLAMLFKGPYVTSFYRALHRYVHSDIRMRRALRRPAAVRQFAAVCYHALRRTAFFLAMAGSALLPHKGLRSMTPEMTPDAAGTPSTQPADKSSP